MRNTILVKDEGEKELKKQLNQQQQQLDNYLIENEELVKNIEHYDKMRT